VNTASHFTPRESKVGPSGIGVVMTPRFVNRLLTGEAGQRQHIISSGFGKIRTALKKY
jgi:hypothetical protein